MQRPSPRFRSEDYFIFAFTFTACSLPLTFEDYWLGWSAKKEKEKKIIKLTYGANKQVDDLGTLHGL